MQEMRRIDVFDGQEARGIVLYHGDLARIPAEHAVDILIVSAFPDDYSPTRTSLIGSLDDAGLSVADLAARKDHDLRSSTGFWLSRPLTGPGRGLNIGRVLCFEPRVLGSPPDVVGELFRGLFPFLNDDADAMVAMPLIGAGDQGWSPGEMVPALLDASVQWLSRGLPIKELKIVERSADLAQQVADEFDKFINQPPPFRTKSLTDRSSRTGPVTAPPAAERFSLPDVESAIDEFESAPDDGEGGGEPETDRPFDVFLSFSSTDGSIARTFSDALKDARSDLTVFDFRLDIEKGISWQQKIDDAIENCRRVVAILSPDYFSSPECMEEIMMARLRNKRSGGKVLHPVYWRESEKELALWLQILNYSDCREADEAKIVETAEVEAGFH